MRAIFLFLLFFLFSNSYGQNPWLDKSFGDHGRVIARFDSSRETGTAIAIQNDGKIIVAGLTQKDLNETGDFSLIRCNVDGSIDTTFGNRGRVVTPVHVGKTYNQTIGLTSLVVQKDGKIVVAGSRHLNDTITDEAIIIRYNQDGSIDSDNFGYHGILLPLPGQLSCIYSLSKYSDGRIIFVGSTSTNGILGRVNYLGKVDLEFGTSGFVIPDVQSKPALTALSIEFDGGIVATGFRYYEKSITVAKYLPNGIPDSSFGLNGHIKIPGIDQAWNIQVQQNHKILVVGNILDANTLQPQSVGMARCDELGNMDSTFGNNGFVKTTFPEDFFLLTKSSVLQSDGKIVIVASGDYYAPTRTTFVIARYNSNGLLDSTFADSGRIANNFFASSSNQYPAVAIQSDGKIVVGGQANDSATNKLEYSIERYLPTFEAGIIDKSNVKQELLVYPNPVTTSVNIGYELSKNESVSIKLLDISGKCLSTFQGSIFEEAGKHTKQLALPPPLSPGTYFINLQTSSGNRSIKIIK